jgi:hypothetical protein
VSDPCSQRHQPFERNHHVVTGLQIEFGRIGLPYRDAARRPHGNEVAGLEHDITRKMLQHVGDLVEIIAGVGAQPPLAVDVAGDPQIIGVGDFVHRQNVGAERREARHVLGGPESAARGDLALLDFARADIVGEREAGNIIHRIGLLDAMGALADNVTKLRLVIEHGDVSWLDHLVTIARYRRGELDEPGRLVRNFGQHLVGGEFLAMFFVVLAHAKEF